MFEHKDGNGGKEYIVLHKKEGCVTKITGVNNKREKIGLTDDYLMVELRKPYVYRFPINGEFKLHGLFPYRFFFIKNHFYLN